MRTLLLLTLSAALFAQPQTALDRYVKAPDSHFKYALNKTTPGNGYTAFVLDMTSQQYLTSAEVDQPVWTHNVTIVRPEKVTSGTALLFVAGGSIPPKPPNTISPVYIDIAKTTGAVVAEIRQIPNEPLVFAGETRKRSEDGIIAYTWRKFMETGDDKWPLRLPMTKAVVRAMDSVTGFMASEAGGQVTVDKFVVAGGSKRGWTTWTTAAVDKRVVAIMPAVIDVLNIEPSFIHHYRAYGYYAPAVADYISEGVMDWAGSKQYRDLMKIEEPYEYRDRYTMPKFLINSTGDQFFLPDSSQFYWKDLKGEKYLRYVPNTDHGVDRRSDAVVSMGAFFSSIVRGSKRPEFAWQFLPDGGIEVRTKDQPKAVKLWQANNPEARDFRLEKIGPAYKSTDLQDAGGGVYRCAAPPTEKGFTAYFIELTFASGSKYDFKFTSGVRVTPDKYPYEAPKLVLPKGAVPLNRNVTN